MPSGFMFSPVYWRRASAIKSEHLAGVTYEFVVLEVADDLLGECLGTLLERLDLIRRVLLEVGLDGLHVALHDTVSGKLGDGIVALLTLR